MVASNVAQLLREHVTLTVESIDRLYLNGYIPVLQTGANVAYFVKEILGARVASTNSLAPMTRRFVANIEAFASDNDIPILKFHKGQRKEDIARDYRSRFQGSEGVYLIGKAQENVGVFRTTKRVDSDTGARFPWITKSKSPVNQYYFYILDDDFGPIFIKFCSYFPYGVKLCLNGHEWAMRQLDKFGVEYDSLDNGFRSCADPAFLQDACNSLDEEKIEQLFHKWLSRLPHPFPPELRDAGYSYDLSIIQAEFALTQVFDRPLAGRYMFEELIREHLDLGRPDQVQLIFARRITRRTPGRFRTRVITQGVIPSLHIDYKSSRIKQYFKEQRALRTETVVNNTYDFGVRKRLSNLPELRELGFAANRRLLHVQQLSHDCAIGEQQFRALTTSTVQDGQRAPALRFGDPRVMALLNALCHFALHLPRGFRNRDIRARVAQLQGLNPAGLKPGKMTYDLRRLRLHGLIKRICGSHSYRITEDGLRVALFLTTVYQRVLRPGLSAQTIDAPASSARQRDLARVSAAINSFAAKALRRT